MPKISTELSVKKVEQLVKCAGRHSVGGCRGLLLQVGDNGAASWLLRVMVSGKRRDIGLGSYHDVTLAEARELGHGTRKQIQQGIDPVANKKERQAAVRVAAAANGQRLTFDEAAEKCHAAKSAEFKSEKYKADWLSAVTRNASPVIGRKPVADVSEDDIVSVLEPIWLTVTETASRLRGRLETILDWATSSKHRTGPNPARWRGNLEHRLANPKKITRRKRRHHPTVPWRQMPAFMADLRTRKTQGAKALEFSVLTTARTQEIRFAKWSEIDLKARVWVVPAERMKSELLHTVPLVDSAIALLEAQPHGDPDDLIFPGIDGPLSNNTMLKLIKDMHKANVRAKGNGYMDPKQKRIATPHGTARSSFKDWARNLPGHVDEVSELALAHVNSDETRAAYARDELLGQRTVLMAAWADFLAGTSTQKKKQKKASARSTEQVLRAA